MVFLHVLQKADDHLSIRPAPSATQRFLVMHQNIKVIMTDGHKDENSLIFPCFLSWGIFLAHTIVYQISIFFCRKERYYFCNKSDYKLHTKMKSSNRDAGDFIELL